MIENGMWHFPTHEIGVKVNEKGEILETNNLVQNGNDIISLKVSNAIFNAIENGDENIIERMNSIYGDKIKKIIDGTDELKISPYVNKKSREYLISSLQNCELDQDSKKIFASVDDNGNIISVAFSEENILGNGKFREIEISFDEYNELKKSENYHYVFRKLESKYLNNIEGQFIINNASENFIKGIILKVRGILGKNNLQNEYSTNEI